MEKKIMFTESISQALPMFGQLSNTLRTYAEQYMESLPDGESRRAFRETEPLREAAAYADKAIDAIITFLGERMREEAYSAQGVSQH